MAILEELVAEKKRTKYLRDLNKTEDDSHLFRPTAHRGCLDMDYKKETDQIDISRIRNKLLLLHKGNKFDKQSGENYARYDNFVDSLVRVIHHRELVQPLQKDNQGDHDLLEILN